jgi:hypothetical protein
MAGLVIINFGFPNALHIPHVSFYLVLFEFLLPNDFSVVPILFAGRKKLDNFGKSVPDLTWHLSHLCTGLQPESRY